MRFLTVNEAEQWCAECRVEINNIGDVRPDQPLTHHAQVVYAESGRSGREPSIASACVREMGDWEKCLLWVTLWGIWPSSEDWPYYYALRGTRGERNSLEQAPGHLFGSAEKVDLIAFLTAVMENGWDAHVFAVANETRPTARAFISHDGWIELFSSSTIALNGDIRPQKGLTKHGAVILPRNPP